MWLISVHSVSSDGQCIERVGIWAGVGPVRVRATDDTLRIAVDGSVVTLTSGLVTTEDTTEGGTDEK